MVNPHAPSGTLVDAELDGVGHGLGQCGQLGAGLPLGQECVGGGVESVLGQHIGVGKVGLGDLGHLGGHA